ncbi:MAG: hypothetical protein OXH13_08350 [Chloroflexi bacterium]|nr:hypothetical protein [Chloroflexota bacterium]
MIDGQQLGGEDVAGADGVGSAPEGGKPAAGDRAGRLGGLLQDLLRTHGRRRTAELLDLSERTLQRVEHAEEGEQLSEQFLRALEDYEATQPGSEVLPTDTAAELANLRRRVDSLERAVPENIGDLPGAVERLASTVEQLQQQVTALQQGGDDGDTVASVGSVGSVVSVGEATGIKAADSPLRPYPEHTGVVTIEAEPGERRFYGTAMPTISAWRRARARRGRASNRLGRLDTLNRLDRLRADERLLALELELVGEHGLTPPPADRPWDGLRRQTELRVTREALGRVRRDRRRAWLRHWGLRLLTLGLWGRGRG